MKNNYAKNSEVKNYKKIIITILIFLLVILTLSFVVYGVVKNTYNKALIKEIYDSLANNEISFFAENKFYNSLEEKFKKNDYNISSDISLSTTMKNNMFSDLDLSKFDFNCNVKRSNKEDIIYNKIIAKYSGNNLLTVEFTNDEKNFAIKSDEIVNKYVGLKKDNFEDVSSKILEKDVDFTSVNILKNYLIKREYIDLEKISDESILRPYIEIVKDNIIAKNISKKENVVVTLENDQVSTTEYTITFSSEQLNSILRKFSSQLENDDELISELVVSDVLKVDNTGMTSIQNKSSNSTVEIQAEENNYTATINIWGENVAFDENQSAESQNITAQESSTTENVVTQNTIIQEHNTSVNQVESNTITNATVSDGTTTSEENQIENVMSEENVDEQQTEIEQTEENISEQQETQTESEVEVETTLESDNTIPEADNYRTQGFISINEESRYYGDDEFIIGEDYDETLQNIVKLADSLDWKSYIYTGAKANCTESEMLEYLQNILSDRMKNANTAIVKVYVAENRAIKLSLEFPETFETLDIEIVSKGDKEKYLNIKTLVGDDNNTNGNSISIYKKTTENLNKMKFNINKIHQNKINKKIVINIETKGNSDSQKYTNNLDFSVSDSDGEFKVNTQNNINFVTISDIDALNDENCLFMDEIDDEELLLTMDSIKEKLMLVLREKNQNLEIIDTANSNTVILSNNENNNEQDNSAKEEAKDVLVKTISEKMGEYINDGKQLNLADLRDLQIENYDVSVSVSDNLLIITVNGYGFKLDSEFNLSDQ